MVHPETAPFIQTAFPMLEPEPKCNHAALIAVKSPGII
jgi:hypothetical protein